MIRESCPAKECTGDDMAELIYIPDPHSYTHGGQPIDGLTKILEAEGFKRGDILYSGKGSNIHLLCQLHDEGDLDDSSVSPKYRGYLDAWLEYSLQYKVKHRMIEKPVHSHPHSFATTPDRVGEDRDFPDVITEIKTFEDGWFGIQTAAQSLSLYDENPLVPWHAYRRRAVILKPNGKFKIDPHNEMKHHQVAQAMFLNYHWKGNHLKQEVHHASATTGHISP